MTDTEREATTATCAHCKRKVRIIRQLKPPIYIFHTQNEDELSEPCAGSHQPVDEKRDVSTG